MWCFLLFVSLPYITIAFPARHEDPFSPLGPWSKRNQRCGIPSITDKLPKDVQEKIKKIWENYKDGEDCDSEHKQTRETIRSLPEELRERIFAGKCGPTFLRNVSSTIRKEFRSVWFDHRLNLELKELALKKLAYSLLSGESLALFNKWEEELQIRKAELNKKLATLSPAAKEAFEKWKQIRMQEKNYLAALPKEIRDELRTLYGFSQKNEGTTTEQPVNSTTEILETTEMVNSTTAQPMIEEKTKEGEFAVFLDISIPEEFNDEAQCSYI